MKINEIKPRISDEEIVVLKALFKDKEGAVEAIRKIFFPELSEENPILSNHDMWSHNFSLDGMSPEQMVIAVRARQMLIDHVEKALMVIKLIVSGDETSMEEIAQKAAKDSAK